MKNYDIEFISTTCRTYSVEAESQEEAEALAIQQLDDDQTVSQSWKENAEVNDIVKTE